MSYITHSAQGVRKYHLAGRVLWKSTHHGIHLIKLLLCGQNV